MAEIEASDVVTKDLIERAIKHRYQRQDIDVTNFRITSRSNKGDNFAGDTVCVEAFAQIDGRETTEYLFLKIAHKEGFMYELNKTGINMFAKETRAYTEVIPAMHHLQCENNLEPVIPSVPRHYYSVIEDDGGVLILEDLAPLGYSLADMVKGLDNDHCRVVMKGIGMFHALGFALKGGNPQKINKYKLALEESLFRLPFPTTFKMPPKTSLSLIGNFTDDPVIIAAIDKLKNMDFQTHILEHIKPKEPYAVICHGDIWCNNMLFEYDTTSDKRLPVDVKLVDLQCFRYAPLATDLADFFYTSTTRTMRKEHLGDLLALYHQYFHKTLNSLKIDFPEFTISVLEKQFKESIVFGVMLAFTYAYGLVSKPENSPDYTSVTSEDVGEYMSDRIKQAFSVNENRHRIKERLIGALEEAVELGVL